MESLRLFGEMSDELPPAKSWEGMGYTTLGIPLPMYRKAHWDP